MWCSATGTPPIHVALIRNSTVLVNTSNTAEITLYEEGNYSCVANSKFGDETKDFFVVFTGKMFPRRRRSQHYIILTLFRPGFFWSSTTGGGESIKAMTTTLGG